jgi:hypothetical protein
LGLAGLTTSEVSGYVTAGVLLAGVVFAGVVVLVYVTGVVFLFTVAVDVAGVMRVGSAGADGAVVDEPLSTVVVGTTASVAVAVSGGTVLSPLSVAIALGTVVVSVLMVSAA